MYLTEEFFMTLYKRQEVIKLFVLPICTHLQTYMYYLHIYVCIIVAWPPKDYIVICAQDHYSASCTGAGVTHLPMDSTTELIKVYQPDCFCQD